MRRITIAVMGTISALVALFSYHTSTDSPATAGTGALPNASSPTGSGATSSSGSGSTYTGDEADTRWGVVQVQITVENGRITASDAVEYPTANRRDQEINQYAIPALNDEVLKSQSGDIDAVSGATVTSDGYIQSLQSAIDQANR